MRILSRYVLTQWLKIFLLAGIGLPVVSVLVYITDKLNRLLDRGLTPGAIALTGVFALPWNVAQMLPAAALFATVFTVGPLSRHSELTAAKAGGVSFHRLMFPLFVAALVSAGAAFWISEVATEATARQLELEKERVARNQTTRYNFVYRADDGWVYSIRLLDTRRQTAQMVLLERPSARAGFPNLAIWADSAKWNDSTGRWQLINGSSHFLGDSTKTETFAYTTLTMASFDEPPRSLLIEPKRPEEMAYTELAEYIRTLDRSGNDVKKLQVDLAIKLALPAACIVIVLFGAPLAVSNPRAGAAWGIAISMGTTVLYLLLINLSKAVGATGLVDPTLSAWIPNVFFGVVGIWLLARVRT